MSNLYFLKSDLCNSATAVELKKEYFFFADTIEQAYNHFIKVEHILIELDDEEREDGDKFADLTKERRYERIKELIDENMKIFEVDINEIARYTPS